MVTAVRPLKIFWLIVQQRGGGGTIMQRGGGATIKQRGGGGGGATMSNKMHCRGESRLQPVKSEPCDKVH